MTTPKIKISQMAVASDMTASDYFTILQNGVNKKATLSNILKNLNSNDTIRINPSQVSVDISLSAKDDFYTVFIQGATSKVGIGTNTPAQKLHVNGNLQVGSVSTDGIFVESSESIAYSAADALNVVTKAISAARDATFLSCGTSVNGKFSLSNGVSGQTKTITAEVLTATNTMAITINGLNFSTVTFTTIGNSVTLKYSSTTSKWCLVSNYGATIA